jgi:hypothetical protein
MPYPKAAIQTAFIAIASPIPTSGQAVRKASTVLATMTFLPLSLAEGLASANRPAYDEKHIPAISARRAVG